MTTKNKKITFLIIKPWYPLLIALFSMGLCRFLFLIQNFGTYQNSTKEQLFLCFIYGLRFDISILLTLQLPFILFTLWQYALPLSPLWQKVRQIFFVSTQCIILWLLMLDSAFFPFSGRRTTFQMIPGLWFDFKLQFSQLAIQYWYGIPCLIFLGWILIKVTPTLTNKPVDLTWKYRVFLFILLPSLTLLGIRGGLQRKPLALAHTQIFTENPLNVLVSNTPFQWLHGRKQSTLKPLHFFSSWEEVLKKMDHPFLTEPKTQTLSSLPFKNVLVFILESFSQEYVDPGEGGTSYAPFLKSLCEQGVYFSHAYSNGRQSIDAPVSLFSGLPSWLDQPFINSSFNTNDILKVPLIFKNKGFTTAFFHGAKNGSFHFDVFAKKAGFENYFGMNEYPEPQRDFDGSWGIFDEPFLNFMHAKINNFKKPFFSAVFTLTSHNPYPIPEKYKNIFPKGTLEIHEGIGYADHALKLFFNNIKNEPWFKETLFVFTGDHTSLNKIPQFNTPMGRFRVPILFYQPHVLSPRNMSTYVAQHVDVGPTLLSLFGMETQKISLFGRSLWPLRPQGGLAMDRDGDIWWLTDGLQTFFYPPISKTPSQPGKLEAYWQYFNNGLIENRLLWPKP